MIPIKKGIYMFEFPKNNLPQNTHSFIQCDSEKGFCRVCGKSSGSKQPMICKECGFIAHDECCENAYSYCKNTQTVTTGYCSTLDEYYAAFFSDHQPHFIKQSTVDDAVCQSCTNTIQGECLKCLCCNSCFHTNCKIYRDCKKCVSEESFHHLLHGAEGKCIVCKQSFEKRIGFHCCWCKLNVHTKCIGKLPSKCSFGQLSPIITKSTMKWNNLVVDCIKNSEEYYWCLANLNPRQLMNDDMKNIAPIIVHCQSQQSFNSTIQSFIEDDEEEINEIDATKEGYHQTQKLENVIQNKKEMNDEMQKQLRQSLDLDEENETKEDQIENEISETKESKQNEIKEKKEEIQQINKHEIIHVVTQGDLSQSLGWTIPMQQMMYEINHSLKTDVDVWSITNINKNFINYFGIGIDAYALRTPDIQSVKILLHKHIHVFLGDIQLDLHGYCGILMMNIPYYDGTRYVDNQDALMNDHMIEIVAFTSPNHFTICQNGNLIPKHIGTSRTLKIVVLKQIDSEIDGIPFILYKGVYEVRSLHQLQFLARFKN